MSFPVGVGWKHEEQRPLTSEWIVFIQTSMEAVSNEHLSVVSFGDAIVVDGGLYGLKIHHLLVRPIDLKEMIG